MLASYVPDSTQNKFGPLTIKHLPTPMSVNDILCYWASKNELSVYIKFIAFLISLLRAQNIQRVMIRCTLC